MNQIVEVLSNPLVQPIAIALVAGAVLYVLSRWSAPACRLVALAAGVWVLVSAIGLLRLPAGESVKWDWLTLTKGLTISAHLGVTQLGTLVVIAAAAFAVLIAVYSFRAMAGEYAEGRFYAFVIWALGGACIVGLAGNLVVLLVGWELVTLMLFLLVNQGRDDAPAGAAKAYGVLGFSDGCLLLAIALLAANGGSASLAFGDQPTNVAEMGGIGYLIYALLLVAALAKAGAVPLHTWIPAIARDAPTSVMAFLPAVLDKLLGIYLLVVVTLRMFRPDWTVQVILMIVGAVTILSAVLMAMMQHNLKRLLAFHAVSQVGYMVLGIATGTTIGIIGGLFHMLNNNIYKCNLFLMSGTVGRATGSDEIEDMGGLARALPITFACGLISALAISGVPPLNGFASKWLIYQGALQVSATHRGLAVGLVAVAVFGSALTLASFVKVMYAGFLSPAPRGTQKQRSGAKENLFLVAPMIVLAAACVLFGLAPQLAVQHIFSPAVAGTGEAISVEGGAISTGGLGFWSPSQATGLIVIGLLIGLVFLWISMAGRKVRVVRPFLGGEVPDDDDDRFRVPGTHFYKTIGESPLVGPLLEHGEQGAMDPYHWVQRYGRRLVEILRAQHTGLLSLYAAWCIVGLAATLIYLLVAGR